MSESIREAVAEDLEPTPPHKKEKTMKKRRFSEALFVYCAIALPLLQFIIFYVAVNINSIFLAFQSYDYGLGSYKFLGFDNFAAFFGDIIHEPVLIISIRNSAIAYACTLFIAMPLGICFSFFVDSIIEFGQLEGMNLFQELIHITLPMIFPTITVFLVTGVADFFTNSIYTYSFYAESAPYNVYTIGYYLFVKVIGSKASLADYPYAAAAGICFTLVAAPITLLVKYLLEKFGPDPEY